MQLNRPEQNLGWAIKKSIALLIYFFIVVCVIVYPFDGYYLCELPVVG
jgi:hypothetical protein